MTKNPSNTKSTYSIRTMTLVALMTAVCCILSPISVPIGPVPISLSVLAVFLTACVLGSKRGVTAVILYILLGLIGMPVFTGYEAGPGKLFGPTGGYIIGYIPLVLLAGCTVGRFGIRKWYIHAAAMLAGLVSCYTLGTIWFMIVTKTSLRDALLLCVVPFIAFDLMKMVTAFIVGNTIRRAISAIS